VKKPTDIGLNRTGIATSPVGSKETIEGAVAGTPQQSFDVEAIKQVRDAYAEEAPPVGTMPPPASLKGAAKTVMQGFKGHHANVLLDLLGERLAFERTGTRLYEALLTKLDASSDGHGQSPTRQELESIRDDELAHFGMCKQAIEKLGADPTVVTPSADVAAVASMGLVQVLGDPRTTLTEALKTILIAELTDNDAWETLAHLAEEMGQAELGARCRQALAEEQEHLRLVRAWVNARVAGQAGVEEEVVATT
jgi:rubrerythrin